MVELRCAILPDMDVTVIALGAILAESGDLSEFMSQADTRAMGVAFIAILMHFIVMHVNDLLAPLVKEREVIA